MACRHVISHFALAPTPSRQLNAARQVVGRSAILPCDCYANRVAALGRRLHECHTLEQHAFASRAAKDASPTKRGPERFRGFTMG